MIPWFAIGVSPLTLLATICSMMTFAIVSARRPPTRVGSTASPAQTYAIVAVSSSALSVRLLTRSTILPACSSALPLLSEMPLIVFLAQSSALRTVSIALMTTFVSDATEVTTYWRTYATPPAPLATWSHSPSPSVRSSFLPKKLITFRLPSSLLR